MEKTHKLDLCLLAVHNFLKSVESLESDQTSLCEQWRNTSEDTHIQEQPISPMSRQFGCWKQQNICGWMTVRNSYSLSLSGTRESAFVFALSAAVLSHSIARSCASGALPSCSCAPAPAEQASADFRWGGCGDNVRYGLQMGSAFSDATLNSRRSGPPAIRLMHLHNNAVGRQVWVHVLYNTTNLSKSVAVPKLFYIVCVCLYITVGLQVTLISWSIKQHSINCFCSVLPYVRTNTGHILIKDKRI